MTNERFEGPADDPTFRATPLIRPEVARRARGSRAWLGYCAVLLAGLTTFATLATLRSSRGESGIAMPAKAATGAFTVPQPLPSDATPGAVAAPTLGAASFAPQFNTDNRLSTGAGAIMLAQATTPDASVALVPAAGVTHLSSPAVVVDLGPASEQAAISGKASGRSLANPTLATDPKAADDDTETFIQRATARQDSARAASIGRLGTTVAEGTIVSATMETAINSDLPGLVRAVIARDVMSFDGTRTLIPRGSRVLGQYKSGVAMGASRVFIIWTRLIRPDGVAVGLTSPGGDDLGRGGLGGKVDRHFLQRFGGSILMSVLNGAIDLGVASVGNGLPVYINSVAEAGQAATSAMRSGDIPPTIKTRQGASVKIFVARDLDFSGVEQMP